MLKRTTLHAAVIALTALHFALPALADANLDTARARWKSAAISSYEYGYNKYCDCHRESPPETVVTVRGGQVVGVRHRPVGFTNEVQAEQRNLQFYWTVDGLFDLVAAALARGATVRASYDPQLGYPTQVYIDYDANFIGDELDVRLTAVTPLAP